MEELIKKFIRFFKFKHRCYYIFDKYDTDNSYTVDEKGVTFQLDEGYYYYRCSCGIGFRTDQKGHWNMRHGGRVNY
jgi:Uri superfamily endonuclease